MPGRARGPNAGASGGIPGAANTLRLPMRVLVTSNMAPSPEAPQRGSFVREQVAGLRRNGVQVETFDWQPGWRRYPEAVRRLRAILRAGSFDVVHAHYGLAGWCAAAAGASPLVVTFHGTDVRHRLVGPLSRLLARRPGTIVAAASRALFAPEGGRPGLPRPPGRAAILPCGIDVERFRPGSRSDARAALGLDPGGRYLLFPAAPSRPVKRHDRALAVARRAGAELLTLDSVPPAQVPLYVNAAAAVLVPSENEGFGLAAVEAVACEVPVLSTPVGIAPFLLRGLDGCLAGDFDPEAWARLAARHLEGPGRVAGGARRARPFGADRMAARVLAAYRDLAAIA